MSESQLSRQTGHSHSDLAVCDPAQCTGHPYWTAVREPKVEKLRRFVLVRRKDHSGVSGLGVVCYGVQFPDGKVVTRWDSEARSSAQTCVWDSIKDVETIHGHNGDTEVVWLDEKVSPGPVRPAPEETGTSAGGSGQEDLAAAEDLVWSEPMLEVHPVSLRALITAKKQLDESDGRLIDWTLEMLGLVETYEVTTTDGTVVSSRTQL